MNSLLEWRFAVFPWILPVFTSRAAYKDSVPCRNIQVVRFGSPRRKRKHRIQAIQSLNRGLLIHAKHGRVLRRFQVQPDDIAALVSKSGSLLVM